MKKFALNGLAIALMLISTASFAGVVDVRFTNGQFTGDQYTATVQIKAQDISFEIGSATLFFDYNPDALANPKATPMNFSENACSNGNVAYKNSFTAHQMNKKGEGNYAILLQTPGEGCPTVSNDWVTVAQFSFDVVDASLPTGLAVVERYTAFNTVDNDGTRHDLGTVTNGLENEITSVTNTVANTEGISIYPNYTKDFVQVQYNLTTTNNGVDVVIYDMLGRIVENTRHGVGVGAVNIDLGGYTNGYYLIEVSSGDVKVSEKVLLAK